MRPRHVALQLCPVFFIGFHRANDAVHDRDRRLRMAPDRAFALRASPHPRPDTQRWRRQIASARVGVGASTMLSSMCVATITGLPAARAARTIRRCAIGTCSGGNSTPRSPRATITASAKSTISSDLVQRRWLFDFGDDAGAVADQRARLGDIVGMLHKRERDVVDAKIKREGQIDRDPFRSARKSECAASAH